MPQTKPEIKPTLPQQAVMVATAPPQRKTGHAPTPPAVPGVLTHDAITKLTYARWAMVVLPESQAWHPELAVVGSEQWIG
jgi:hypothetical protein